MTDKNFTIPIISSSERTPLVEFLLGIIRSQQDTIQRQEDENKKLKEVIQDLRNEVSEIKKQKKKPIFKSSNLDKPKDKEPLKDGKRAGSEKVSKKATLEIHETIELIPTHLPAGSIRVGSKSFDVQSLIIKNHNIRYIRQVWQSPDGLIHSGQLPDHLTDHFSSDLKSYILYQHFGCCVTQPLILSQLKEFGVNISAGQLNNILIERNNQFHQEKSEILKAGLKVSSFIQADDTGARHKGKNGYCTFIGNSFFSWFQTTSSKSRINFLKILNGETVGYVKNDDMLDYLKRCSYPKCVFDKLAEQGNCSYTSEEDWHHYLTTIGITKPQHIKLADEGALIANAFQHGFNKEIKILSDDAGQFDIPLLYHALCWIHAERLIKKLIPVTELNRKAYNEVITSIWDYYDLLKKYQQQPDIDQKLLLEEQFDKIFTQTTCFESLSEALMRIYKNKAELLLVLDYPEIPLHNNGSERDIREFVKRRKISGSTRSDNGLKSRDTFVSLKKTCQKVEVSFWKFLKDRLSGALEIPRLADLIIKKARQSVIPTCVGSN